jgi:putative FmdB family regulatory protein
MPTYGYKREDGTTFEVMQRITDDALETCPTTGQKVKRLIGGGVGLIFKGSGFYLTDYARKKTPPGNEDSGDKKSSEEAGASSTTSESKGGESKTAKSNGGSESKGKSESTTK